MSFAKLLSIQKNAFKRATFLARSETGYNQYLGSRRNIRSNAAPGGWGFQAMGDSKPVSNRRRQKLSRRRHWRHQGGKLRPYKPNISAWHRDPKSGSKSQPLGRDYNLFESRTIDDTTNVVSEHPEVRNFAEQNLEWMIRSTKSHMKAHGDRYPFQMGDIKILSDEPNHANTLISSTAQQTSQWLVNRMLSNRYHNFVQTFTKSADFEPLRHLFKISGAVEPHPVDGIMTMKSDLVDIRNVRIEQTDVEQLDKDWMLKRGYGEQFDAIFDEDAVDNIMLDDYVQTTIYGQCLKKGGVLYLWDRKISGDIAGRKLRAKICELYPNSHFELIAERDDAWGTQFVFLKALSCTEKNMDRESDRKDEWGDSHLKYAQSVIRDGSKVTENAGRDMHEGMDRIEDAVDDFNGRKREAHPAPSILRE